MSIVVKLVSVPEYGTGTLVAVRKSGLLKASCWRGLKEFAGSVKVTQIIENLMQLVIGLRFHSSAIKDVDHNEL